MAKYQGYRSGVIKPSIANTQSTPGRMNFNPLDGTIRNRQGYASGEITPSIPNAPAPVEQPAAPAQTSPVVVNKESDPGKFTGFVHFGTSVSSDNKLGLNPLGYSMVFQKETTTPATVTTEKKVGFFKKSFSQQAERKTSESTIYNQLFGSRPDNRIEYKESGLRSTGGYSESPTKFEWKPGLYYKKSVNEGGRISTISEVRFDELTRPGFVSGFNALSSKNSGRVKEFGNLIDIPGRYNTESDTAKGFFKFDQPIARGTVEYFNVPKSITTFREGNIGTKALVVGTYAAPFAISKGLGSIKSKPVVREVSAGTKSDYNLMGSGEKIRAFDKFSKGFWEVEKGRSVAEVYSPFKKEPDLYTGKYGQIVAGFKKSKGELFDVRQVTDVNKVIPSKSGYSLEKVGDFGFSGKGTTSKGKVLTFGFDVNKIPKGKLTTNKAGFYGLNEPFGKDTTLTYGARFSIKKGMATTQGRSITGYSKFSSINENGLTISSFKKGDFGQPRGGSFDFLPFGKEKPLKNTARAYSVSDPLSAVALSISEPKTRIRSPSVGRSSGLSGNDLFMAKLSSGLKSESLIPGNMKVFTPITRDRVFSETKIRNINVRTPVYKAANISELKFLPNTEVRISPIIKTRNAGGLISIPKSRMATRQNMRQDYLSPQTRISEKIGNLKFEEPVSKIPIVGGGLLGMSFFDSPPKKKAGKKVRGRTYGYTKSFAAGLLGRGAFRKIGVKGGNIFSGLEIRL